MPLLCSSISKDALSKLNHEIVKRPLGHPLRKETMDGDVTVVEDNGVAVFHSAAGFYFHRIKTSLEETIAMDIMTDRKYLCSTFELDANDQSVKEKLINRFQDKYGKKYSNMIDHHCIKHKGLILMLVKFPSCVLSQMLSSSGGILKTIVTGNKESLKQIPTLVKFGNITDSLERTSSVFATEYKSGMLPYVINLHYDLLRDIISKPNIGVTVNPFALWEP